jgi:putative ABC transport system substrate-binding protein
MHKSNTRRHFLAGVAAGTCFLALPSCAHRRQAGQTPRVGFLTGASFPTLTAAFREELRKLGYVEGHNLILEMRQSRPNSGDGEAQAAELAAMDLDLIFAASLHQALAVRERNPNMPMVIGTGPNLVGNGFARSLEHPGGIVTGMDELPPGLTGRRLRLLKAAVPHISRVALLSTTPGVGSHEIQVADAQETAAGLGIAVSAYRSSSLPELQASLDAIVRDRMDGLVVFQGGLSLVNSRLIIDTMRQHRIAAIYQSKLFAASGGLMALSPDQEEQFREAARYVDRILKGAKPGDLPIKHPSRYFLTVNATAAREIGLTLPPSFLAQADSVLD